MAEKKKSPSTARPRAKKAPSAEIAPLAMVAVESVEAAPVSPAIATAPLAEAEPVGPTLAGLEVDARPTIEMPAPPAPVTHARIAQRAHEIHLARGGSAFDNWLQAERELQS